MEKFSYLIFSLFLLIADQLSKWVVVEHMIKPRVIDAEFEPLSFIEWYAAPSLRWPFTSIEILPFFNIVMVWNQGVSFGMFSNDSAMGPILLSGLSLVIAAIFLVWLFRSTSRLQSIAIALVISGAIGNVIDRMRFGAVIDFLDVHVMGYHWPAFNIADSAICIGVFLLIIYVFFFEPSMNNEGKDAK